MTEDITKTEGYRRGFQAALLKQEEREKEKEEEIRAKAEALMLNRAKKEMEAREKLAQEKRKGAKDLRKGGMVVSTVDNRKNK